MALMREKRLRLGKVELTIGMEEAWAAPLARSLPYRWLLRPVLNRLQAQSRNGRGPDLAPWPPPPPEAGTMARDPEVRKILDRIADVDWYHTIELGHGVATPGFVDHREQVHLYGLPDDLSGKRCLDAGTYDGFWAFEMERRGAQEVVAIDLASLTALDFPSRWRHQLVEAVREIVPGKGFTLAHEILASKVRREVMSVYDLSPARLGTFDLVLVSDVLIHLRDPMRALESVFSVTSKMAIVAETYNPELERFTGPIVTEFRVVPVHPIWWAPSTNWLKAMMSVAGFEPVQEISRFVLKARTPTPLHKVALKGSVQA